MIFSPTQVFSRPCLFQSNITPSGSGPGAPIGAIVGGVIGGIVVIGGVAGFLYWRSTQRRGYTQL